MACTYAAYLQFIRDKTHLILTQIFFQSLCIFEQMEVKMEDGL